MAESAKDIPIGGDARGHDNRLRPDMVSFRVLVLRFVRRYFTDYGLSPSQGEITRALDVSRSRVREAIRSLTDDGLLLRVPGERGLRLPDERDAALRTLRELGYQVEEGRVTDPLVRPLSALHQHPELDYPDS